MSKKYEGPLSIDSVRVTSDDRVRMPLGFEVFKFGAIREDDYIWDSVAWCWWSGDNHPGINVQNISNVVVRRKIVKNQVSIE